ncbi:MAG: lipoyl(octanoyl) transferase [Candidatus Eremiobacter antarcticus]|nr:lipoyl(octanoyl) transferase LipB [Candidatus Eremiobacteraeota bacterium]MBC5808027.1 lipoyl(octanoyl) transferase LipB [Candidatus Eremiobacteraeota bacterium]PZR63435.1 MAG: lipoyl(octanoyl) transferase [Candidatus Eremiobacter sp. RRmetagenome_bin22]
MIQASASPREEAAPHVVSFYDLGRIRYESAWILQRKLHAARAADEISDALLFCEHEPVITMGKSGQTQNLLVSKDELKRRGIDYFEVERGGDLTYHGPGQLVGYPIFKLPRLREVQGFVRKMESAIIATLQAFGIEGERRSDHPGVFVGGAKIASIGAAVRSGVTFHGFALDVRTDLNAFQAINPCGMPTVAVTSMAQASGHDISVQEVEPLMLQSLEAAYEISCTRQPQPAAESA